MIRIDSLTNPRIKRLVKLRQDASFRQTEKTLLIEGKNLIQELVLLSQGVIYTTQEQKQFPNCEQVLITQAIANKLSATLHSEEIFAEMPMPEEKTPINFPILVLDAVSDPGNLGTLLRTALAFNFSGVIFMPGCCDPFNPKALRASKGALFSLPYCRMTAEELFSFAEKNKGELLAADLKGDNPSSLQGNRHLLILGNEGQGLSHEVRLKAKPISIPMDSKMESLNVAIAGGILMYLLKP